MFALALGAMSVGQGYYRMLPSQAEQTYPVTAVYATDKVNTDNLKGVQWQQDYQYVVKGQTVYFNATEFNEHKLPTKVSAKNGSGLQTKWVTGDWLKKKAAYDYTLDGIANQILNQQYGAKAVVTENASEMMTHGVPRTIQMVKVSDMMANDQALSHNQKLQEKLVGTKSEFATGSYATYSQLKGIFGGIEFMGIFLGIGFLAMLAATLMFKTLSGVADDKNRYRVLAMIGTSEKKITQTIAVDLGILFVIPMAIGILDVVFGLQMFAPLMAGASNAYLGFVPSLIGIVCLYTIYYCLTVWMYRRLIKK